jgi:predicted N-acyltransferase
MAAKTQSGRLRVYARTEDLPRSWDELAASGGLGLDRRFLQSTEQSTEECSKRYLIYESPSGAAAVAIGDLLESPTTRDPVVSVLLGRMGRHIPAAREWVLPMLALGCDVSSDAPVATNAATVPERRRVFTEMLASIGSRAREEAWTVAVTGVPTDDTALTTALGQQGYIRTLGRPFAELRLSYECWDDFLEAAAIRSKHAAYTIRKELRRAACEDLRIVDWDPAQVSEARLHELLDEHERRLNNRSLRWDETFLKKFVDALGNNVRVLLALHENQLQGVVVLAWSGSRGYVLYPGMIPKDKRAAFAYFNLVYYAPIRLGFELGLESLAFGNGVFPAKIRRGCHAVETSLFLRPRTPIMRAAVRMPIALHRHVLARKYAPILKASAFSFIS